MKYIFKFIIMLIASIIYAIVLLCIIIIDVIWNFKITKNVLECLEELFNIPQKAFKFITKN